MAQGYYTLEEAAALLGMSTDELKQIARRGEIRSFQDRGTWRFRVQDIQEMARRRGASSDPELALSDSLELPTLDSGPKSSGPKSSGPKSSGPKSSGPRSEPRAGGTKSTLAGPKTGGKSSLAPPGRKSSLVPPGRTGGTKSSLAGGPKSSGPPSPRSAGPRSPGARSPRPSREAEVFDFNLEVEDEAVDLGKDLLSEGPGASKKSSSKSGPKSGPKSKGPATPPPYVDSDIRLVSDDPGIDFQIEMDSDVRLSETPRPSSTRPSKLASKSGLGGPGSSKRKLGKETPAPPDSGVRLVPMDSDSDVRITDASDDASVPLGASPPTTSTDSDIRLELDHGASGDEGEKMLLTEEIDLDAELKKSEAAPGTHAPARPTPASSPLLPTESPFELSDSSLLFPDDSDADMPLVSPDTPTAAGLVPVGESSSPLESEADSDFKLEVDEVVELGEVSTEELKGPTSGLNLSNPIDSGISLEHDTEGSDEIDLRLSIEDEPATPRGTTRLAAEPKKDDTSSEFELSLPGEESESSGEFDLALDSDAETPALADSDSEFELALEGDSPVESTPAEESDSEFELTLDAGEESKSEEESSSEFELTLDAGEPAATDEGSSEFELTLDAGEGTDLSSDSEFELTLEDDSSPTATTDSDSSEFELSLEDTEAPRLALEEETEVETEHDLAALDEEEPSSLAAEIDSESESDIVAIEEEEGEEGLGSSDFDLSFEGGEDTAEEESGSEVVPIDEEDVDSGEEIEEGGKGAGFADLGEGEVEEAVDEGTEEVAGEPAMVEKEVVAAPWGPLPVVFMLPCVIVLFLVGVMGFEMVQTMTGYKQPGLVTRTLGSLIGVDIKN